ncbi:MAG: transglycosylase family protein, partial [Candidatus Pacebacteria bacterium]|nr:transglycosylase family protein [Candidatus Paceibacterota bacterium]
LYSPEYKVPTEVEDEISQVGIETSQEDAITQWLFEDVEEDPYKEEVTDQYLESFNGETESSVIDQIGQQESGGNYEAVNPTSNATGRYQFVPSHWASQIKSFMGLPEYFNRDQVMQAFKKSPQSQEQFMQYVTNTIYKPEVEKLRPLAQKYNLNDDKLIRMLHYRGLKNTRERLQTGNFNVSEEEKTKYKNPNILEYLNK